MKKRLLAATLAALTALSLTATAFAAEGGDLPLLPVTPNQTAPVSAGDPADVKEGDWFKPAVDYVLAHDLIDLIGVSNADDPMRFEPENAATREEVAETIFRDATLRDVSSVDEDAGMSLREMADVDKVSENYLSGVSFCYYTGIMAGNANKELKPTDPITREEFAAVLTRYYKYLVGADAALEAGMAVAEFTDFAQIEAWAHEELQFCINAGLLKGNADGSFNPKGDVVRAELAQILFNLEQGFVAKPVEGLKLISQ